MTRESVDNTTALSVQCASIVANRNIFAPYEEFGIAWYKPILHF